MSCFKYGSIHLKKTVGQAANAFLKTPGFDAKEATVKCQ